MVTDEEYEAATKAGDELYHTVPNAVRARYDRHRRRVVVKLSSGMDLAFSPRLQEERPARASRTRPGQARFSRRGRGLGRRPGGSGRRKRIGRTSRAR